MTALARAHIAGAALALLASAAAAQTPPAAAENGIRPTLWPPTAAALSRHGALAVTVSLFLNGQLVDGTAVTASAYVYTQDQVFQNANSRITETSAKGGVATLRLTIPYQWQLASSADQVFIQVTVFASATPNSDGPYSYSNKFIRTLALPADGATTQVTIDGTL